MREKWKAVYGWIGGLWPIGTWVADSSRSIVCRPADADPEVTDGKPILRAECPNGSALERIALLEHRRRKAQNEFIQDFCKDASECCGTMKYCPLAKSSS
ncbi:E2 domain-associated cysteine-rich protein [uncultured Roseobacter sp.]